MDSKLLHLGCGELVGPHWINVDSSPNVILDNHPILRMFLKPMLPSSSQKVKFKTVRYLDLRERWPFETGQFDGVYSSHFFEHLTLQDGEHVLRECFRVLKPGGRLRFLIPSIASEVGQYLKFKEQGNALAATEFARLTNVFSHPTHGSWWYRMFFSLYNKNTHKMFYDAESLSYYFTSAGFEKVQTRSYLQSDLPHLKEVENPDRFIGAVCVEGTRSAKPMENREAA